MRKISQLIIKRNSSKNFFSVEEKEIMYCFFFELWFWMHGKQIEFKMTDSKNVCLNVKKS